MPQVSRIRPQTRPGPSILYWHLLTSSGPDTGQQVKDRMVLPVLGIMEPEQEGLRRPGEGSLSRHTCRMRPTECATVVREGDRGPARRQEWGAQKKEGQCRQRASAGRSVEQGTAGRGAPSSPQGPGQCERQGGRPGPVVRQPTFLYPSPRSLLPSFLSFFLFFFSLSLSLLPSPLPLLLSPLFFSFTCSRPGLESLDEMGLML